jgi:hypothetical protein
VTYYVIQNGSSSSPVLHDLVRAVKHLELLLECQVEVIHVPGTLMIVQGTDGLSRGIPMAQTRQPTSSLTIAAQVLAAVPFSPSLGKWLLGQVGLPVCLPYTQCGTTMAWSFEHIFGKLSIWNPTLETTRQALRAFLDIWVEGATATSAIFVIPRVLQRDWSYLSKHVHEMVVVYPRDLPPDIVIVSHVPFVILYVPRYVRSMPPRDSLESSPSVAHFPRWHQAQADYVRGL